MLIFQNLHLNLETVLQNDEMWYNKRNEAKQELWLDAGCIPSYVAMNRSIFEHLHETYPGIYNYFTTQKQRVFINGQSCRPMSWTGHCHTQMGLSNFGVKLITCYLDIVVIWWRSVMQLGVR